MKTKLQIEFEKQTPTIKGIRGNEYNIIYCAWLELQVERGRKQPTDGEIEQACPKLFKENEVPVWVSGAKWALDFKKDYKTRQEVEFEVWLEGYIDTGESGKAQFLGVYKGKTFKDACEAAMTDLKWDMDTYDAKTNTYWGCGFFDSGSKARESYG